MKRIIALLLAVSLLAVPRTQAQQQVQPAAPLVIGGIVIIVAAGLGFVGCKAVKACRKIAKGRTNAPPEELFLPAGAQPEFGAAFFWPESGDCYAQRLVPSTPVVTTMCPVIDGSATRTLVHADVGEEFVQSWGEMREELAGHGLAVTTGLTNFASFERGRQPCYAEQVPITFDWRTHVARVGAGGVLVVVERSEDLKTWEALMAIEIEPWMSIRLEDVSDNGACFYRVTTSKP